MYNIMDMNGDLYTPIVYNKLKFYVLERKTIINKIKLHLGPAYLTDEISCFVYENVRKT